MIWQQVIYALLALVGLIFLISLSYQVAGRLTTIIVRAYFDEKRRHLQLMLSSGIGGEASSSHYQP